MKPGNVSIAGLHVEFVLGERHRGTALVQVCRVVPLIRKRAGDHDRGQATDRQLTKRRGAGADHGEVSSSHRQCDPGG